MFTEELINKRYEALGTLIDNKLDKELFMELFNASSIQEIINKTLSNEYIQNFTKNYSDKYNEEQRKVLTYYFKDSDYFNLYIRFGMTHITFFLEEVYNEINYIEISDMSSKLKQYFNDKIDEFIKSTISNVKILKELIDKYSVSTERDIYIFRGIYYKRDIDKAENDPHKKVKSYFQRILKLKKGDLIKHPTGGFLSFSLDPNYSWLFKSGNCCLFRTLVPKGTPLFILNRTTEHIKTWPEIICYEPILKFKKIIELPIVQIDGNTFDSIRIIDTVMMNGN